MHERFEAARADGQGAALRRTSRRARARRRSGSCSSMRATPFANIALTDNVVRFATRRYCDNPLIVQGPGAGPEVTAGGVFADLLRLCAVPRAHSCDVPMRRREATAFAPASVGNVAIGFDILGHTVRRARRPGHGAARRHSRACAFARSPAVARRICRSSRSATRPARRCHAPVAGARRRMAASSSQIEKGIPLGSGLGGSAASAVAAVVAANALLGRAAARGSSCSSSPCRARPSRAARCHVDNIAPSLFGGLVLTVGIDHPRVKQIPVPRGVRCVLVHPHMFLSTREARAILSARVDLSDFVWQTANLAGFISGCYTNDLDMIRESFEDVVIEPQRQALIPGFREVRARGDGRRRARLLDLGRRADRLRLVRGAAGDARAAMAMAAAFAGAWPRRATPGSRPIEPRARACWNARDEASQHARRRARTVTLSARRSRRDSRRTADSTCRESLPRLDVAALSRGCRCAAPRRRAARAVLRGRRSWSPSSPTSSSEAFDFPAPVGAIRRRRLERARAVPRARPRPSRISARASWRRALARVRTQARADARSRSWWRPRATPAARWPRPSIGRPGVRGRGAVSARAWCRRARSSSSPAGAATCARFACAARFDDCQRLVKEAFADPALRERHRLSSANSINLGRLLPQVVLLRGRRAWTCARRTGRAASFVMPSGNLGNAMACVWARASGCRSGDDRARAQRQSHRARLLRPRATGVRARASRRSPRRWTSAIPSNMERLRAAAPGRCARCGAS